MAMHPYSSLPDSSFWRRSVADRPADEVDPIVGNSLTIKPSARIATAGSCFAQRLARELEQRHFNILRTEPAPDDDGDNPFYRLYSAAYGNIYTTAQLHQLLLRAYGSLTPRIESWRNAAGRYVDPFRPALKAGGFETEAELAALRTRHLACVRQVFEQADVLIFTLGLTETWSGPDGEVVPTVPGAVDAADYGARYRYCNLSVEMMRSQLLAFADALRHINPRINIVLTVSPVAMIATYEPRHVLVSNSYSKAALRVVADEACRARDFIHYFPSYEIITGPHARGAYLESDHRTVSAAGICRVMAVFARHFLGDRPAAPPDPAVVRAFVQNEYRSAARVLCDEEGLDPA
jgi:hypothetical protein